MSPSAATVIRQARSQAGLSQSELARRASIAQSVVSAYERGRREPGLPTLIRLVEAAGHELVIEVHPSLTMRRGLPDTPVGRRLRHLRRAVIETAARRGATNVRVFGSVARGSDGESSDIDLLVDLDSGVGLVALAGLERELGELLGSEVDVVPADALKPDVRPEVMAEAIPL